MATENSASAATDTSGTPPAGDTAKNGEDGTGKDPAGKDGEEGEDGKTAKEGEEHVDTEEEAAAKATEAAKALNTRKQTANERIATLTRERHEAERRAERAEEKARKLEAAAAKPDPSKFDDAGDLQAAETVAALNRRDADSTKEEATEATNDAERATALAWRERIEIFKIDAPDFEEVAFKSPINEATARDIARMEEGPAIAYFLGKNPAKGLDLNRMSARDRAVELGRLAGRLTTQPARKTSIAPPPVTRVEGKGGKSGTFDAAKSSFEEYRAKRKAGWSG